MRLWKTAGYTMFDSILKHLKAVMQKSAHAYIEGRYDLDERAQQALDELGLPYHCSFTQVKKRYFELCRRFHPDAQTEIDNERFLRIKEAYDLLKSVYKERRD
jgi:hypothetical protein